MAARLDVEHSAPAARPRGRFQALGECKKMAAPVDHATLGLTWSIDAELRRLLRGASAGVKRNAPMLKKILFALAVTCVVLAIVVVLQPPTFHIERSITIAAPAPVPHALVNDFHAWSGWSPWEKLDPALKRSYEGPGAGVGAKYAWTGNDDVGEGRMTIEHSSPTRIGIRLEFIKPFAATNRATFAFDPVAEGTKVTWAMDGDKNFASKAFGLVMDTDHMIGADFERGLASMKTLAESSRAGNAEAARARP
jgi:hypothetical protein